jgi:hypothetical protein
LEAQCALTREPNSSPDVSNPDRVRPLVTLLTDFGTADGYVPS